MWFDRRTNYTRSLAVMSMVGYILGLGDRSAPPDGKLNPEEGVRVLACVPNRRASVFQTSV